MQIKFRPIESLVPYARNSRKHSPEQVDFIAASMQEFGFTNAVLADDKGIVAGHGRVLGAKKLYAAGQSIRLPGGDEIPHGTVPVIDCTGWTDAQRRAYIITDNKSALNSEWDEQLLALELQELVDQDYDVLMTGFDQDEIDELLASIEQDLDDDKGDGDDDDNLSEPPAQAFSKPGDVWVVDGHRIMCGDSTSLNDVTRLLDGRWQVDMVLTDPPYGIEIVGKGGTVDETGRGRVASSKVAKAGIYAPVAGDGSIEVALKAIAIIKDLNPKVQIIWGGNYYAEALGNSSCWVVWDKQNGDSYFADAELAWTNQDSAVRIFQHMWNGMIKASEHGEKRIHPTQKPVALAEWCLDEYGEDCQTVLDLFGGSGFTLMACQSKAKQAYIMELSPHYVDAMVIRYFKKTGRCAVHSETGEYFPI